MLEVENLSVRFGASTIVDDLSFSISENHWLMVVGPNGAGKSTLVNAISGSIPSTGKTMLYGKDIAKLKSRELAKMMGVLMQTHIVTYSFTVEEVVRLGRYAYSSGVFSSSDDEDEKKIDEALKITGMDSMRDQSVLTLSGGELQRTFLAQVIAQDPKLMILDEPTNHLDLAYQKQVFELVQEWLKQEGRTVISVVHDLSLARTYGTDALLMNRGKLIDIGECKSVLSREKLKDVYSMDVYEWMQSMLSQWNDEAANL